MYRHFQTFSLKYFLIINIFLFFFVEWFCGRRRWWWWGWRWTCSLHTLSPPSHLCVMPPPFFMPSRNKPMKKLLFFTPLFFTLLFNAHNELKTQILKVCYYLKSTKAEGGQWFFIFSCVQGHEQNGRKTVRAQKAAEVWRVSKKK